MFLPRAVRVYFATATVNLRKSFDGLSNEVRTVLERDPLSGHVFVFLNKRRNQVKLLVWTRGGFTIVHKRLERGTFCFPAQVTSQARSVPIDAHELTMLLERIELEGVRTKSRWEPPRHTATPPSMPNSDVLALVSTLVARNSKLELRLKRMLSRDHKNEGVSTAQLRLFLDALAANGGDESDDGAPDLGEANAKLRDASGIDAGTGNAPEKPAKQPPMRKAPRTDLPRVDNPSWCPRRSGRAQCAERSVRASGTT